MFSGYRITLLSILLINIKSFAATIPDLPKPVSNNATVLVQNDEARWLISFMGLGAGKDWQDVHNQVWSFKFTEQYWQQRTAVPASLPLQGRLASVAVGVNGIAYLFGGYTVAADHSEISSADNYAYNVLTDQYTKLKNMPVPVDDSVALVYQQRYVYLISGWHNDGNVNLVQIYDIKRDSWQMGSPFPGAAVFGHAGGIVNNRIVVCDGVKVLARQNARRTFAAEPACYIGLIDPLNYAKIDWQTIPHPTHTARYRMAASGVNTDFGDGILFIGGSANPYNFNGVGYNGEASEPDNKIWFFHIDQKRWIIVNNSAPTMDHRGLLQDDTTFYILGGMTHRQSVLNRVTDFNKQELLSTINNAMQ